MKNNKIIVKTKTKNYPIYFGNKVLNSLGKIINKEIPNVRKVSIISDKNIPTKLLRKINLSLKKYKPKIYKMPTGEKTKSLCSCCRRWNHR